MQRDAGEVHQLAGSLPFVPTPWCDERPVITNTDLIEYIARIRAEIAADRRLVVDRRRAA